ncbi:hypothetical protein [Kutzneria sp. NPDC052558]|uniref:hypothetical protein n=1 Tax=Kutzneria sp. NPDC052558 TaxID=3364121 RepID=UPI0037C74D38
MNTEDEQHPDDHINPARLAALASGLWCFYTDANGEQAQLAISVQDSELVLTTATGEVLRFTGAQIGMLLTNLEAATGR